MPQLFGFIMAVIGAILFMRWLSRKQALISKTLNEVSKARARAREQNRASAQQSAKKADAGAQAQEAVEPARQIETLEEGEDGVFRPSDDDRR
jgi:hypothetical protein